MRSDKISGRAKTDFQSFLCILRSNDIQITLAVISIFRVNISTYCRPIVLLHRRGSFLSIYNIHG